MQVAGVKEILPQTYADIVCIGNGNTAVLQTVAGKSRWNVRDVQQQKCWG